MTAPERVGIGFIVAKTLEIRTRLGSPLSTILATSERLLERADLPADLRKRIQSLRDAGLQIRDLLKELDLSDSKTRAYLEKKKSRGR
jgi:hypothetical protein